MALEVAPTAIQEIKEAYMIILHQKQHTGKTATGSEPKN
jgi:hypothetical protein